MLSSSSMSRQIAIAALVGLLCAHTAALPTPISWNIPFATQMARMSFAAYCDPKKVADWSCKWCSNAVTIVSTPQNDADATYSYIAYDSHNIYLVFRGSHNIPNWIDVNLRIAKIVPYKNVTSVMVHEGFWDAYLNLKPQILSGLQTAVSKCPHCSKIVVSGHSLGAALSMLAGLDLVDEHHVKLPLVIINYGCPRVGNAAFGPYFNKYVNAIRVVHAADLVPHLPPTLLWFLHTTQEVWNPSGSTYQVCSKINGEDPTCSDSLYLPDSISDHMVYMGLQGTC